MGADPAEGVGGDEVLGVDGAFGFDAGTGVVARQVDTPVVVVEIGGEVAVGVALAVVAEEVVEAVLERAAGGVEHAHAPLADDGGGVAGGLEEFGDGEGAGREGHLALGLDLAVCSDGGMAHVEAGDEGGSRGGADGGAAVGLGVAGAFAGHAVEAGGLDELLPEAADVALGEVVAEDEDQVGPGGLSSRGYGGGAAEGEEAEGGSHGAASL